MMFTTKLPQAYRLAIFGQQSTCPEHLRTCDQNQEEKANYSPMLTISERMMAPLVPFHLGSS